MIVWKSIAENIKDFSGSNTILLAASGGVDSMVLLNLCAFRKINIEVAHFQHGIRPDDSIDVENVRKACLNHNIPFHSVFGNINEKSNVENIARNKRWDWLETIAHERQIATIMTGHNLNDNIENFLYRIMRGTNAESLVMPEHRMVNGFTRYKPMLEITKDDIREYARKHNVVYREDITNEDTTYDRNWIRHNLMPMMMERRNIMKSIPQTMRSITTKNGSQ